MRVFLYSLYHYCLELVMSIPFHFIRNIFINRAIGARGDSVEICRNVEFRIPKNIFIASNCVINKRVLLDGRGGKIIIGNNVDIAQDCKLWTLQHDYNDPDYIARGKPIRIEDYVWLASNVTVLPGVTIGKGAVVATSAVVTKDVEPYSIVAGIPAKKIGERKKDLKYKLGKYRWFH